VTIYFRTQDQIWLHSNINHVYGELRMLLHLDVGTHSDCCSTLLSPFLRRVCLPAEI